jgi:hypothetical protein
VLEENLKKSKEVEEARIAIDKAVEKAQQRRSGRRRARRHPEGPSVSIVALHTQALVLPEAELYLDLLGRALQAARLNNAFPDRRQLQNSVDTLRDGLRHGVYGELYVDARAGLPNLASFTRVRTDHELAAASLARMGARERAARRGATRPRSSRGWRTSTLPRAAAEARAGAGGPAPGAAAAARSGRAGRRRFASS